VLSPQKRQRSEWSSPWPVEVDEDAESAERLLASLLLQYLIAYVFHRDSPSSSKRQLFEDAEQWFADNDPKPVGFVYVCSVLDMSPDFVRRRLPTMKSADLVALRKKRS